MQSSRFVMIGGFLGAGKTTTILQLAKRYHLEQQRVGIVTNDQAAELVDTQVVRNDGFDVSEIAGGCFCCRFDELAEATAELGKHEQPDVILAEPVGSCTDLAATVMEPLRRFHSTFELGPLVVLVKPEHGRRILLEDQPLGVSQEAAYIFEKQIEEADVIAVNKIDRLNEGELRELTNELDQRFPQATVLGISAREGRGVDQLFEFTRTMESQRRPFMALDYDRYAKGEADLGWFNGSYEIRAAKPVSLDAVARDLIGGLADQLRQHFAEPAHIKAAVQSNEGALSVANLVAADAPIEATLESGAKADQASITLNARVVTTPDVLSGCVNSTMATLAASGSFTHRVLSQHSFQPGRPEPTYQPR